MGEPKIVVVDYHKGNLSSVVRGLARAGAAACTSDDPEQIRNADGLVIPGVGAFYDAIAFMRESGEADAVLDAVAAGTPLPPSRPAAPGSMAWALCAARARAWSRVALRCRTWAGTRCT